MSEKLRIGYFADGIWAHEAFRFLISDDSLEIKFICVRYDTADPVLKEFADRYQIDYLKHRDINSTAFLQKISQYHCDLFISMSFDQIFKDGILSLPTRGTINCHAGKLPFYRGRNVLNWVLINDEKEFGITVHFVDEGIDTGDIILQRTYPITDQDDYGTLLETAHVKCAEVLYEAVRLIQEGSHQPRKQNAIHPCGFYCGKRKAGDERIVWNQSSRDIFNFIRALCKPGPMATTTLHDSVLKINRSEMIDNAPRYRGIPGQVVGLTSTGIIVKTKDTTIKLTEHEYEGMIRLGDRMI
ncbi:MAG: methionyl-tRNA formyltransferase [Bacillota bacterium]|nr:methionyl-tRNA formyltransferase [Bacillota bacterium]MDW7678866.1 methionyl-tRNA formyltransferase [Bacillota bacterium]